MKPAFVKFITLIIIIISMVLLLGDGISILLNKDPDFIDISLETKSLNIKYKNDILTLSTDSGSTITFNVKNKLEKNFLTKFQQSGQLLVAKNSCNYLIIEISAKKVNNVEDLYKYVYCKSALKVNTLKFY